MIDGSQQTRTWNQMIFLVITFKFRLSAVRICLPSKLVISLPRTFKCKSNIKNQELSLITPDTTDAGSHKRAKTSPFSWARPSLSFNLTAPTYPEKVLEDQRASKAPDRLPEHHWVRLYSTQLWPSQAADARAGPSLSDWSEVIRYTISNIIEAENEKMTPDCCSISDSKNTLLLLQIISVSTWPGNVLNRYKTYTIILFINSVDKLRNEFQDWVWWMKLTKKVCCLWTVENQLWNCGSLCLLQCAGPSGSKRRVHESCNNFRANSLPLPQTNNQNLSICATMEADKSVGEEVNHITMFCFLSEK